MIRLSCCVFVAMGLLMIPACSDSSKVTEASCSACAGKSYTEADCKAAGAAAGCETSTFQATVAGCTNGCSFTNCNSPPECGAGKSADAGAKDAAVDPSCAAAPDGLFSSTPPCADASEVNINGAKKFACKCTQACPCNFECGSIALSVGGVISSVCAPKK